MNCGQVKRKREWIEKQTNILRERERMLGQLSAGIKKPERKLETGRGKNVSCI
jgi:hypothetical protein